jgi:hypothetical protein
VKSSKYEKSVYEKEADILYYGWLECDLSFLESCVGSFVHKVVMLRGVIFAMVNADWIENAWEV